MYWPTTGGKRIGAASVLALALVFSPIGSAQEARGAVDRDIATLTQQIATKQQQIATLRGRPSPEQAELSGAQAKLAEARAAFKANGSAENESRAKNAEFKVKLAEIKYSKAHPDVGTLVDELEQLQSQLAAKQREAKEPREAVAAKPAVEPAPAKPADNLAAAAAKRQQEQELVRAKQESEAQQKEIERLKAALAAKEAKEKEAAAASAAPAPAAAKPAATPVAPKVAEPKTGTGGGALKLIAAQEVVQELQQLQTRLAAPGPDRGTNDALYLKRPDTKATNKDKVVLKALGKEQYRGQAAVESGQYLISVGLNQWPVEFTAAEVGQTTFLYDNSDAQKPRLLIYSSALEPAK